MHCGDNKVCSKVGLSTCCFAFDCEEFVVSVIKIYNNLNTCTNNSVQLFRQDVIVYTDLSHPSVLNQFES